MHFDPSQRIQARLCTATTQSSLADHQLLPVYYAHARSQRSRQFLRCEFEGFHEPEIIQKRRYTWMGREARIDCYFAEPLAVQYIWIETSHTALEGSRLKLRVDGELLAENLLVVGSKTIQVRLPQPRTVQHVKLQIESTTFVPAQIQPGSHDSRQLGVSLRGIVFAHRRRAHRIRKESSASSWAAKLPRWIQGWLPGRAA